VIKDETEFEIWFARDGDNSAGGQVPRPHPPGRLKQAESFTRRARVELFLPKFRMTWGTVDLGSELWALGMPVAFRRYEADFPGINSHAPSDDESLYISEVLHQAFVEVSEKGTEATAAMEAGILAAGIPQTSPTVPGARSGEWSRSTSG
jgi:serine protease inhibitor